MVSLITMVTADHWICLPMYGLTAGRSSLCPIGKKELIGTEDPYGWYREGPIGPDFKIDQVLPHLFEKSVAYIKERAKKKKPFFLYLLASPAYSNRSRASLQGCK